MRIWDNDGKVAATVRTERFPPVAVSDVAKMGRSLVLAATRFENGKPIQAIVILTLDGETMNMTQELEGSSLTKRGSGKAEIDPTNATRESDSYWVCERDNYLSNWVSGLSG